MRKNIGIVYTAFWAAICACYGQATTNGTELADNLTSRSRVVVDAFENASNRVHALIQEVSPAPDLSGYATTGSVAAVSNAVAQVPLIYRDKTDMNVYGFAPFHVWTDYYDMNYDKSRNSWWIQDGADYRELIWTNGIWRLYKNSTPTDENPYFLEATNDFFATYITFGLTDDIWRTSIYATNGAHIVTSADAMPYLSTTGGVVNGNVDFLDGMMNISDIETYMYRASITELNLQYPEYVNIGAGYTPLTSIFNSTNDYVRKNNGTATNLTANILTVGSRIAGTRGNDSASFGGNHFASGLRTIAMGQGANATNSYSIVFNGYGSGKYGSHGVGTANFNPREGAYGFYVGESNLHQVVEALIALDNPVVVTNRDDNDAVISVVTNQPLDLVRASEIADYIPQTDTSSFATKDELSPISGAVNALWTYVYGESVWIAVTNYMRTIGGIAPSFQLWEVRGGNTNLVYWSKEEITNVTADLMYDCKTQMEASVAAVTNKFAWSAYQSASGERNPQPTAVTIVSTPSIMLTGGGEWYKCIDTGSSAVWVLKSNGLNTFGGDANGYFRIVDDEGNAQFEVVKTASYEVGALATSTDFSPDNEFQVTYNAQGNEHPFILATTDLGTPFIQEENGAINSLGITTTWDKVDGNWRVTISQDERSSSLFVHAKMIVQGENVIKNNAPIDVSGGILCTDGVHKCRPVYNNGTITWQEVQ